MTTREFHDAKGTARVLVVRVELVDRFTNGLNRLLASFTGIFGVFDFKKLGDPLLLHGAVRHEKECFHLGGEDSSVCLRSTGHVFRYLFGDVNCLHGDVIDSFGTSAAHIAECY